MKLFILMLSCIMLISCEIAPPDYSGKIVMTLDGKFYRIRKSDSGGYLLDSIKELDAQMMGLLMRTQYAEAQVNGGSYLDSLRQTRQQMEKLLQNR